MNLRDLQYVVAVADHRHFGRAADACFASQPTLSTQLRKLERELGVELFERQPRHVLLTPAGEAVVAHARAVLMEVDGIERAARAARDPESGTVRLGVFPTLGPYLLPRVVTAITDRYPRLELLLVEDKTDDLLAALHSGRLDAAVLARPVEDAQLVERPMFAEDFLLAAPDHHRLATGADDVTLADLDGEEVLLLDDGHCLRDQALEVCHLAGAAERAGFRATSLETLRHMVAAGVGVTLLPALAVQPPATTASHVVLRAFREPTPRRELALYHRGSSPVGALLDDLARLMSATVLGSGATGVHQV